MPAIDGDSGAMVGDDWANIRFTKYQIAIFEISLSIDLNK
jgi:hypothetical protein